MNRLANKLDYDYKNLLKDILQNGSEKDTRNGKVLSVFGRQIRHNMRDGFPLLTTKKIPFKIVVTELLWFLRGETNIKPLVDANCNIWNGDAYRHYEKSFRFARKMQSSVSDVSDMVLLTMEEFVEKIKTDEEFAKKWGELGPIYGKQWRKWKSKSFPFGTGKDNKEPIYIDQIINLVNDLKNDPDSRRLMVNAWNVGELDDMVLPPCHFGFQCFTRELTYKERYDYWFARNYETGMEHNYSIVPDFENSYYQIPPTRALSLMWNQRSVDTFLGLPFNIASYGVLLQLLAEEVNMVPEELIGNLGDTHLYLNHVEQAQEQIGHDYTFAEKYQMLKEKVDLPNISFPRFISPSFRDHYQPMMEEHRIPENSKEPFPLPTLLINSEFWNPEQILGDDFNAVIEQMEVGDFQIQDYKSHETIKAPLSN